MELNREQIVKALECCASYDRDASCGECPYMYAELADNEICSNRMAEDALALIKELTAENERLREHIKEGIDLAKQIPEMLNDVSRSTVRKMPNMFAVHFGTYTENDEVKVLEVFKLLGKFAEEILEDT